MQMFENHLGEEAKLSSAEFADLKSQIATSSWGGVKKPPKVNEILQRIDVAEPPLQGIFYQGRYWDAKSLLIKFIRRAKKEMIVIDAYVGVATLDMLAKRGRGVKIELVTHSNGELKESDFEAFRKQCGKFTKNGMAGQSDSVRSRFPDEYASLCCRRKLGCRQANEGAAGNPLRQAFPRQRNKRARMSPSSSSGSRRLPTSGSHIRNLEVVHAD